MNFRWIIKQSRSLWPRGKMTVGTMCFRGLKNQSWHTGGEMFTVIPLGNRTVSNLIKVVAGMSERNKRKCFITKGILKPLIIRCC